ncbi:NAD(+) diphosphatase [Gayadomonas joobiniege]|uniref:NAD(+) diphosphatase n=1 Tax=Gayadomonas joobiniege TaxID=1234606 RepID=UPI000374DA39|nr:NAD(+) diphosphatase [Gayadomonas joobiniege]
MLISPADTDFSQAAYWLVTRGDQLLLDANRQLPWMPADELFVSYYERRVISLGKLGGQPVFMVDISQVVLAPEQPVNYYSLMDIVKEFDWPLETTAYAAKAVQFQHFLQTHKFCGRCGKRMQAISWEIAMQCKPCQHRCYPKVHPCVIMAVVDGDRILLARSKRNKTGLYSILAGFVEPGETLEQAVAREVFEEVGVEVKNIRYFGSQPWPFPHQLMVGFVADYAGGKITIDEKEISQAAWYNLADLPATPGYYSIAGQIIESLIKKQALLGKA